MGLVYEAGEFLDVASYKNVQRWTKQIAARPAAQRGRMVNRVMGDPATCLPERHDAGDFETRTIEKLVSGGRVAETCVIQGFAQRRRGAESYTCGEVALNPIWRRKFRWLKLMSLRLG
jgi:hypothetical protein